MIARYSLKEMSATWSEENKFKKWLDVELAACKAHCELGNIPKDALDRIVSSATFSVKRIQEIENEVHHDVIAFLTSVNESLLKSDTGFVHLGLTSSDIVDTAFSLLIQEAGSLLLNKLDRLLLTLKKQAHTYKKTLMMGRTHGVHAEPTTLGLKLSVFYESIKRGKARLEQAIEEIRVGKLSGAVGTYAHIPMELESKACKLLNLRVAPISTQILQRDLHANFITVLATIGGSLESIAVEIRSLQKTECNEVLEPFQSKQKGSSAMPHKKNPIICERITGISRIIRGYSVTALENQALWHERDISHSSTERIIFPNATKLLDYALEKIIFVIDNLVVNDIQMKENIQRSYNVFFSQKLLLLMVQKGWQRDEAYRVIQSHALKAFDSKELFDKVVNRDPEIRNTITQNELNSLFLLDNYLVNVDKIFDRVY